MRFGSPTAEAMGHPHFEKTYGSEEDLSTVGAARSRMMYACVDLDALEAGVLLFDTPRGRFPTNPSDDGQDHIDVTDPGCFSIAPGRFGRTVGMGMVEAQNLLGGAAYRSDGVKQCLPINLIADSSVGRGHIFRGND